MGRKKSIEFSAAKPIMVKAPSAVVNPPMAPIPAKNSSVPKMDDSTYMYMLMIGQLMYDKKHLIAEKLAADLSLSKMVLASSDALLRIIKKSREIQNMVLPACEIRSTITTSTTPPKRGRPRASNHVRQLKIQDMDEIEEIDITEHDDKKSHGSDMSDDDDFMDRLEEEGTNNCLDDGKLLEKSELDLLRSQLPPNATRETEDGRIIMMYSPQEKFPCTEANCKQTFLTKENLDYHLVCSRIHNPLYLKDWGCRYCGKEFSVLGQLKQHEKMKHEGHDKEVCHECGRQFDSAEKMKRHIDVHHLQKKYRCRDPICPMEFSSESGAKYHYKRVHLNEQISCSVDGCSRKFDRNCDLKRHLDKVHRDPSTVASATTTVATSSVSSAISRNVSPFSHSPITHPLAHTMESLVQPPQTQHQQQAAPPPPPIPAPPAAPTAQQPLFPSPFSHEDRPFTTMQAVTQQMILPSATPVIATSTSMTHHTQQQQLNQEQLQAIQSLQYLHHQPPPQLSTQPHPQFPPPPTTDFHGSYMY